MARRRTAVLACALALCAAAPAGAAEIHAHRGGPVEDGVPVSPENSMTAFERAVALGADVIELDAKLAAGGVPVVFHDATLDAVTPCTGRLDARTLAELAGCPIDILGTTSGAIAPNPDSTEPIPTLAEVLAWARDNGVRLNLEIKNLPTDPDFDPTPAYAERIVDAVVDSRIDPRQVLIQSFWPPNVDVAEDAGFETSLLTLRQLDEPAIPFAALRAYEWVSPQWPPLDATAYVTAAHAAGRRVAAWTLDDAPALSSAALAGVDAVITNDVPVARAALGR